LRLLLLPVPSSAAPPLLLLQVSRILYSSWILEKLLLFELGRRIVLCSCCLPLSFILNNIEKTESFAARLLPNALHLLSVDGMELIRPSTLV
jgi:hypothetical protein